MSLAEAETKRKASTSNMQIVNANRYNNFSSEFEKFKLSFFVSEERKRIGLNTPHNRLFIYFYLFVPIQSNL